MIDVKEMQKIMNAERAHNDKLTAQLREVRKAYGIVCSRLEIITAMHNATMNANFWQRFGFLLTRCMRTGD